MTIRIAMNVSTLYLHWSEMRTDEDKMVMAINAVKSWLSVIVPMLTVS